MKTTFLKGSKFIVFAMMFIAALTTFTACGGDDEDESNTVKINGQETKVNLMNAVEFGEQATITLFIASVDKNDGTIHNLVFTLPTKEYGRTITARGNNVMGTLINGGTKLNAGSQFTINKSKDGVYKISFQLAQTIGNKTTTIAGSYEGKSMTIDPDKE